MKRHSQLNAMRPNRRDFVLAGAGWTAAGLAAFTAVERTWALEPAATKSIIAPGQTILFQGDSITDVRRKRNDPAFNSPPRTRSRLCLDGRRSFAGRSRR